MNYRYLRFPEGKLKAVTFSYDDGADGDLRLAQILENHNMKGTFNLNSTWIRDERFEYCLTRDEVRKYLLGHGHEVAVHGAYHLSIGQLRPIDGINEVLKCRTELEGMFDTIIRGMAYPGSGVINLANESTYESIRQYLKDLGIVYARTLGGDNDKFELPQDWYLWTPTAEHGNENVFNYIEKFANINNGDGTPKLFYLWGHSHGFDVHNTWDRMEKICSGLGELENTWYATNMEIYEYVQAYNSLSFSVDGTRVYNPSNKEVWFAVVNAVNHITRVYSVKQGETIVTSKDNL